MVLYRKLAPWKHLFATAGPLPVHGVSLALGRLATLRGAVQAADGHFAEAMRVHEVVGAPFGLCRDGAVLGPAPARPRPTTRPDPTHHRSRPRGPVRIRAPPAGCP